MKKMRGKLTLRRETLRRLQNFDLAGVGGAKPLRTFSHYPSLCMALCPVLSHGAGACPETSQPCKPGRTGTP